MTSAILSLLVAHEGDTGLMGFTSTSQGFFMLGSGPNLNNVSAGGSETELFEKLLGVEVEMLRAAKGI